MIDLFIIAIFFYTIRVVALQTMDNWAASHYEERAFARRCLFFLKREKFARISMWIVNIPVVLILMRLLNLFVEYLIS
jgi:hypothetical protein